MAGMGVETLRTIACRFPRDKSALRSGYTVRRTVSYDSCHPSLRGGHEDTRELPLPGTKPFIAT